MCPRATRGASASSSPPRAVANSAKPQTTCLLSLSPPDPLGTPHSGQRYDVVPAPRHAALDTLVAVRALRLLIIDRQSSWITTAFGDPGRLGVQVHDGAALVSGARAPTKQALRVVSVSLPHSDTPNELAGAAFLT